MAEVNRVLWTFVPGQHEEDAFAYLNDVRLALRSIRLADVRSIAQAPSADVTVDGWDSVIKTYSIPLQSSTAPILKASAAAWIQGREGRSLSIKLGNALSEKVTPGEVAALLDAALARNAAT